MDMPSTVFLVVRNYGHLGIGSPDVTGDRDAAYDLFTGAVDNGDAVAVWRIATYGSLPVSIADATDEFEHEMQEICIGRGIDWPEVVRFDSLPIAAE